ncbi:hypothetical protein Hdeb2414_s0006g00188321 [Helianthus debilis subsp. tardiflorus]
MRVAKNLSNMGNRELVYAYAVRMSAGYYNGNGRVGFIDGAVDVVALIQFG